MTDRYRIVTIADPHEGAHRRDMFRKMGVTADRYDAPFREAVMWASENDADLFIVAGDIFDKRQPTVGDYKRVVNILGELDPNKVALVGGNHDMGVVGDDNTLWPWKEMGTFEQRVTTFSGRANDEWFDGLGVIAVPWPRPSDYGANGLTIEDDITLTQSAVFNRLQTMCDELPTDRPVIGVGHLMTSYGGVDPENPSSAPMLGKDVVIPWESLTSLPNIGVWLLGHCHPPGKGYVGSTQPTDWGEAGQVKSFTVVDVGRECPHYPERWKDEGGSVNSRCTQTGDWFYHVRQIPYTTSLKLWDQKYDWLNQGNDLVVLDACLHSYPENLDAIRYRISTKEGVAVPVAEIQKQAESVAPYVEVIVEREVKRAARVETAEPLNQMSVHDSFKIWLEERDTDPELVTPVMAAVDGITEVTQ